MEFAQTTAVPQLYTATDTQGAPTGRLLLLLPEGAVSPPPSIQFAQAWDGEGALLLVPEALTETAMPAFAAAAWDFLADPRLAGTRVAWLQALGASGRLTGTALQLVPGGSALAVGLTLRLRSLELQMPAGAPVAVDFTACELTIGDAGRAPVLAADWGELTAGTVDGPVRIALQGPLQGCARLQLQAQLRDLDALDVGLRFFYGEPPDRSQPRAPAQSFFLSSLRYPLFAEPVTLYPCLDPLGPLDPTRTFFAFNASDADLQGGKAGAIGCHLRSTLDDPLQLVPLPAAEAHTHFAALVPTPNQQASAASSRDPFYLAPVGDYALPTPRAEGQLMGGLSGVEYFTLPAAGAMLSYFAGGSAYAAGFLPDEPAGVTQLVPTDNPTTSYASVTAESGVDYYAQPDQSVLYNYGPPVQGVSTIVPLAAVPVHAASPTWPPSAKDAFPLLAFAGLSETGLAAFGQLETQVVSPARRRLLQAAPARSDRVRALPAAHESPSQLSTTPQGLLASYVPDGDASVWERIVLAQMRLPEDEPLQLRLTEVKDELLSAFQSNKLFLVISNREAAKPYLEAANALITIGADPTELWRFDLTPSGWKDGETVLIVKFYDRSIEQLVGDTETWASAETFNALPHQTSATIKQKIEQAKTAGGDYAAFVEAVTDQHWNGILALEVPSPLADLPSELEGLAAGIDRSLFQAHHIGIAASKIKVPPAGGQTPIGIADSSMFGLIDYHAPASLPEQGGDWLFQVETLKVLFAKSAVAAFSSVVELEVNTLFGEAATLEGGKDNILRLFGVYQEHVVNGEVVESYVFQTRTGEQAVFDLRESKVLNAVAISKVQFVTVTAETTATEVHAQFLIWGLLDFKVLTQTEKEVERAFDILSFGREQPGEPPRGLAFANLILNMRFNPTVEPEVPSFTFDASALALDPSASEPREGSLFKHLPLTLAGFTQANQGVAPTDVGYMGVQTPLTQSELSFPWYSLDYDLNLGSAGALAAKAGFVATLTAAWSPGGTAYRVFTGLKLPGSNGSKRAIPIESIFDISFRALEIVAPPPSALIPPHTFILVIYGIGFQFLSFTFPPSGQVNFALFGDPQSGGKGDAGLGWYAAYGKTK